MRNDKLLNYLHLHFIVFIWGFTAVLGALISLEAIPLVWYRMLLAAGFVFLFLLFKKENLRFSMKTLGKFCFAGILIAVHWLTFFGAIKASNVSVTLAVLSTGAFFCIIVGTASLRKKNNFIRSIVRTYCSSGTLHNFRRGSFLYLRHYFGAYFSIFECAFFCNQWQICVGA